MLPQVTMEGRVTADPELRFAPSGVAVGSFRLAANSRKKTESGEWVDDKVLFMDVVCFKQLAENVAESCRKGDLVTATGSLQTDQWEDTQTGEKRSKVQMVANSVAISLTVRTVTRSGIPERRRSDGGAPPPDPWASAPVDRPQSDEPPF